MTSSSTQYLRALEADLSAGHATEHTYRPALKSLIETQADHLAVTNEPRHVACGAPDFSIAQKSDHGEDIIGYFETKDVGANLDQVERTPQLKRYLAALRNLILTDYLEFRWYTDGQLRRTVRLASLSGNKLVKIKEGPANVEAILRDFLSHTPQEITSPSELAQRMARLALLIRESIVLAFEQEQASDLLKGWRKAFADVLIAELNQPEKTSEFADMFAQTLAYGLFSARIMDLTPGFSLSEAQRLIPKTNPFLRRFFTQITGPDLDDEPFSNYVNDLVALLDHSNMPAILTDFGKRTKQEDPTVHFYETFLAAYDPKLRELRGVYYTPQPVVSFIVRAIDEILKTRFDLKDGLADTTTVTYPDKTPGAPKGAKKSRPKVLILDPATGTATFPYTVIDHIRQTFMQRNNAGLWNGYVRDQLLPRLFGFELLMAPYAVAHFKLALQLAGYDLPENQRKDWAYQFIGNERLNIFLTNTLDKPHEWSGLPLFTQFLADETIQANQVKQDLPVMVILGNPPYANFGRMNRNPWILELLEIYKEGLGERKINLDDDFIKFIRWGQWRIDQTGNGILGFITNNTYLDGVTHRSMRRSLLESFSDIYILNLHGSVKKKEICPDGSKDENIFDIQQGVAISIFVKKPGKKEDPQIHYKDFWGLRNFKYQELLNSEIQTIDWINFSPKSESFYFVPKPPDVDDQYLTYYSVKDIFLENVSGIQTGRDEFVSRINEKEFNEWIQLLSDPQITDTEIGQSINLPNWTGFDLLKLRKDLRNPIRRKEMIGEWLYRPFDIRPLLYDKKCLKRDRGRIMAQLLRPNIALVTVRQLANQNFYHVFVTKWIGDGNTISLNTREYNYYYPLYSYSSSGHSNLDDSQTSLLDEVNGSNNSDGISVNLQDKFLGDLEDKLGLKYSSIQIEIIHGQKKFFTPIDIINYIYAILHSPTYRTRYANFLKIDFPRIPLTHNSDLFWSLCDLGAELVSLHLLDIPRVKNFITSYPIPGDNRIEKGYPKYDEKFKRVSIDSSQYFEGIPNEVWNFQIGGYQVLDKWLKDRRGRLLSYEDLTHYQEVVVALVETVRLMEEIDRTIPGWPIE